VAGVLRKLDRQKTPNDRTVFFAVKIMPFYTGSGSRGQSGLLNLGYPNAPPVDLRWFASHAFLFCSSEKQTKNQPNRYLSTVTG
jgi:hypothetical protein